MKFANKFANTVSSKPAKKPAKDTESYWKTKLKRSSSTGPFSTRMMHAGSSKNVSLGTTDKTCAAKRAAELYRVLKALGWEAALQTLADVRGKALRENHKPDEAPKEESKTVGWYLGKAESYLRANGSPETTIGAYVSAFRCIVRESADGPKRLTIPQTLQVPLAMITPARIQTWSDARLAKLMKDHKNPMEQQSKKRTVNGALRNARSLFKPDVLEAVFKNDTEATIANPFSGIKLLKVDPNPYESKIDIQHLIGTARNGLRKEATDENQGVEAAAWIILLLAFYAGLRANEIDKLERQHVDQAQNTVRIRPTASFRAKTAGSLADIPIEPEVVAELKWYWAQLPQTGNFAICPTTPLPDATTGPERRRLNVPLTFLCKWLRSYTHEGTQPLANVQKPLHELRKEVGSVVMKNHDIFRASVFLRHKDIQTTTRHYADTRSKVTPELGHLLKLDA